MTKYKLQILWIKRCLCFVQIERRCTSSVHGIFLSYIALPYTLAESFFPQSHFCFFVSGQSFSNRISSKVDKFGDTLLERIKMHVLLLSLLATVKNVKLQCKVLREITPTVQFVIFCYYFFFVIYEVQPDSVPRCLTSYSNRECFGLIQNKKLRCISNHSALSSAIIEFAFPGHKFAPHHKIFSVLQTTVVRSEHPGRSSMYGFFHTTPKNT